MAGFRWPGSAEMATTRVPPRTGGSWACAVAPASRATRTTAVRHRLISGLHSEFDRSNRFRKTGVSRYRPDVQRRPRTRAKPRVSAEALANAWSAAGTVSRASTQELGEDATELADRGIGEYSPRGGTSENFAP